MKDYQRILTEPIQFLSTEIFKISQKLNEHALLIYQGVIADQEEENYLRLLQGDTWMSVRAEDEGGEKQILFHGLITSYTLEHVGTDIVLSLECMSGTCLLDRKRHLRTFQDIEKQYSDIIKYINCQNQDAETIIGKQGDQALAEMVVQYNETDWEFLKRLASRMGCFLTAACHRKGSKYYWGIPELGRRKVADNRKYTVIKQMNEDMVKTAAGVLLTVNDTLIYRFRDREIYRIGEGIQFLGQDLYIYQIHMEYQGGECIHTYDLRTLQGLSTLRVLPEHMTGASMKGTVTQVKQDVVQVRVHSDENKESGNQRWFPYSTVYSSEDGTGWYCMPEVGDEIRLHLPSAKEEEAYVASAVHLKNETSRQNPDCKSIKNKYGKEILYTPDSLILTNNDGLKIMLLDQQGILIESNKAVQISAQERITVSSNRASVVMAATEQVTLQSAGAELLLNQDVSFTGGEFRMQ